MANYTIELREIVEQGRNIFPFNYPFYDDNKRIEFERSFIRHFYFREIGVETIDRFIFNLEDKMRTVFPYYNELFKTANMEYNILDNYYITEKTETTHENRGRYKSEGSMVGRMFDDEQTTTDETRNVDVTGKTEGTGNSTKSEESTSETVGTGTGSETYSETVATDSERSETKTATKNTTNDETVTSNQTDVKKFLDTPQGAVNLEDNKFVTTLNHDVETKSTDKELTENVSESETNGGTQNTDTLTEGDKTTNTETETKTDSSATLTETAQSEQNTTGNEQATGNTETVRTAEQKRSEDQNTKSETEGSRKSVTEFSRRGNIGVDTDADMLQKHIKLQKVLQQIELMFFNECEDLFMLVW